jgi:hypothetical protein
MHDYVLGRLDRFGLPAGWGLIATSTAAQWLAVHALPVLNTVALAVGIVCTAGTFLIRLDDWARSRRGGR